MQNLLLGGELLSETIDSLVFFEQAQWFVETLRHVQPRVSLKELENHASKLLVALQRLFESKSCTVVVTGSDWWQAVESRPGSPVIRLTSVAREVGNQRGGVQDAWIEEKIDELAKKVESEALPLSAFEGSVEDLRDIGCLASTAGARLTHVLTRRALDRPDDLDEFETIAKLMESLPESFSESERASVQDAYIVFVERFIDKYDSDSPDDIRDDASRLGNVGDLLGVDTKTEQETLEERAKVIEEEKEMERDWDGDDDRRGGGSSGECSDGELDSMFRTLGN